MENRTGKESGYKSLTSNQYSTIDFLKNYNSDQHQTYQTLLAAISLPFLHVVKLTFEHKTQAP